MDHGRTRAVSRENEIVTKLAPAGVFGYAAGKSIIAKKLVTHFPKHAVYTEPFCGSAAMFFTKEQAPTEVLNDLNEDVTFAHKAVKTLSKSELAELERKDWVGSAERFAKLLKSNPTSKVDRLYKFLYLVNFSYGNGRKSFNHAAAGRSSSAAKRVAKFQPRYKDTTILQGPYEKAVKDYDSKDAFHFLDPPYAGYSAPGGGVGEKQFDEQAFRKHLEGIQGNFLVTYGVKGKLDTSGFEVKRMRQPRTLRYMRGVKSDPFITHLLISNYKVQAKSLGDGIELDDVMQIIDTDEMGSKIMVTGSRTSVSVPDQLVARAWKNDNDLLMYPETTGPLAARAHLRFLEKSVALDLAFDVNDATIGWTFDVQRAATVGDDLEVAKTFSVEGSRFFRPLTQGVPAREMVDAVAESVVKMDRAPTIEYGLQTEDRHEYFVSKNDELTGQLVIERDKDKPLGEKYPFLATFIDHKIIPNAVLKGGPMPPDGVSALPRALERIVPEEFRYWDHTGERARKTRDALAASGFLDGLAYVDGELARVLTKHVLYEPEPPQPTIEDWPIVKASGILPEGWKFAEVFSPNRDAITKASAPNTAIYVDAGAASDGVLEMLAQSLADAPQHYVVTAIDSSAARDALSKMGRPFMFRPSLGIGVDAIDRVFVTSLGVRSDEIEWLDKARKRPPQELPAMYVAPPEGGPSFGKAEWSTAYVNDLPDSSFLFIEAGGEKDEEGKTKPRSLRHFPYKDKDGKVDQAHVTNAIARIPQSNADGLSADKKQSLQERARHELENLKKADLEKVIRHDKDGWNVYSEDGSKHLGGPYPSKDKAIERLRQVEGHKKNSDLSLSPGEAGYLQPAVGYDAAGNPKVRRKKGEDTLTILKADDEKYVLGIVLEPDTVDAQKDIYSADEVRAAAHKYMDQFQNTGLMHREIVNNKVAVLESYLAPTDFNVGGQAVKKGTWLMAVRVKDPKIWQEVKSGGLTGFSIGGSAQRSPDPAAHKKYMERQKSQNQKLDFQGIPLTIDRPRGHVQHGIAPDGTEWTREYKVDYGFIPRTKGGDGEGLDVFVGPNPSSDRAFWITQKDDKGQFDEYKLILGYDSADEAKKTYLDHVPAKYFAGMHEGNVHQIKALLNQDPEVPMAKAIDELIGYV